METNSKLPLRETQVCQRVRVRRLELKKSQRAFADGIGVNRDRIAALESNRAPVRFQIGYDLCRAFNISLRWLATGSLPKMPFTPISERALNGIASRSLFSSAYDTVLGKLVDERLQELAQQRGVPVESLDRGVLVFDQRRLGVSQAASYLEQVVDFLKFRSTQMNDEEKLAFAHRLSDVAFALFDAEKMGLTETSEVRKVESVKSELRHLLDRVRSMVSAPGMKAKLAIDLGVPQSRVSEWLGTEAKCKPSGENTLRLLNWVTQREGKRMDVGRALTQPTSGTQLTPSKNEKRKSGQAS